MPRTGEGSRDIYRSLDPLRGLSMPALEPVVVRAVSGRRRLGDQRSQGIRGSSLKTMPSSLLLLIALRPFSICAFVARPWRATTST